MEQMENKKKKISFSTVFFVGILVVGIGIMLYPTISNFINALRQSHAVASYDEAVGTVREVDREAMLRDAEIYNEELYNLTAPLGEYEVLEPMYKSCLDILGNGIMGYITIDKIHVQLPIYHGTDEAILNDGVGHLQGSSLPVGGENTHAVLTAHRGLPSAKLFTDLDKMEVGDCFCLTIMGKQLWYEVDQILIVEPDHKDEIKIVEGMDYLTLQTCTPYGINSHRLLVRGHRTTLENVELVVHDEAVQIPFYVSAFVVMVPMLLLTLIVLIIIYHRKQTPLTLEDLGDWMKDEKGEK